MQSKYFTLTPESIGVFMLVLMACALGAIELVDTITHFTEQWYWYVIATFYTVTLNELFSHRICCHRLFDIDLSRPAFKILSFLHAVDHGVGPLKSVCLSHQNHHMYADQGNKDILNPKVHWFGTAILSPITFIYTVPTLYPDKENFFKKQYCLFNEFTEDLWVFFVEEYRFIITIIFWLALYFIAPVVLFKVVFMGRFLMSIFTAMGTFGGHMKLPGNYRNFNTNDNSYNNIIFHYCALGTLGTMLQNNHHGIPNSMNHGYKWFEIDIGYYIMKMLKPLLEKKLLDKPAQ